jgi:hypothetical protein
MALNSQPTQDVISLLALSVYTTLLTNGAIRPAPAAAASR